MKRNGFAHVLLNFIARAARRNAAGEIPRIAEKPVCVGSITTKYFFIASAPLVS